MPGSLHNLLVALDTQTACLKALLAFSVTGRTPGHFTKAENINADSPRVARLSRL